MSNRRPVFSTANLLAYLEATSLGLVDVGEDERRRALEAAQEVKKTESRKWRAHRRPSPGRSRPMRVVPALVLVFSGLCALPMVFLGDKPQAFPVLVSSAWPSSRPDWPQ